MTKAEFLALPDEVINLAARICSEEVSDTQVSYIIGTQGLDTNQVTRAVEFIERTKTKSVFWVGLMFVLFVYFVCNLLLSLAGL
jgi:hypothetical protein